jgi:hypothetical protein
LKPNSDEVSSDFSLLYMQYDAKDIMLPGPINVGGPTIPRGVSTSSIDASVSNTHTGEFHSYPEGKIYIQN